MYTYTLPDHNSDVKLVVFLTLLAAAAAAQAPTVTKVLNSGIGDTAFAPLSIVYIYGNFPAGLPKDFTVTVGGRTGFVTVANSTGYITAVIPADAPLGMQPLVVSYRGNASTAYPIPLRQYAPEFQTTTVVPVTTEGPKFPLASYYPFAHQDVTPVTLGAPAAPGEHLLSLISGAGPTNPPIKLGGINNFSPLAVQPVITIAGLPAPVERAGSSGASIEVDFVVPNNAPLGFDQAILTVAGVPSNIITLPVATRPVVTSVLSGASFKSPGTVAPGSIISIFGIGFGPKDNLLAFPATNVNGTSVLFDKTPAPIFALASLEGQINALVPYELPTSGTVDLTLNVFADTSVVTRLNLAPAVPAIFFFTDPTVSSRRNAAALIPNTAWLAMPRSMATAMGIPTDCTGLSKLSTCAQPPRGGDVVQLFVTGLGKATPKADPLGKVLATGSVAPADGNPLYLTIATPLVKIGGMPATVQYSGIAPGFAGLYQVNVQIPLGVQPGDDVPVEISMPGSISDTATIAISN